MPSTRPALFGDKDKEAQEYPTLIENTSVSPTHILSLAAFSTSPIAVVMPLLKLPSSLSAGTLFGGFVLQDAHINGNLSKLDWS